MNEQLNEWKGLFGDEYTDRNVVEWQARFPLFRQMLGDLNLKRVLEIGCNRGHNLVAMIGLLGEGADVIGIEPNAHARALAKQSSPKMAVLAGDTYALPLRDRAFDLVMTWGVLIHVPLSALPRALAEIYRVSRRYILAVEYYAKEETAIPYRGHDNLLWKRDFTRHYRERFPDLRLMREGFWGKEQGADRVTWWLLEKGNAGGVA